MGRKQHVSQLITIIQFRCLILQLVLALTKKNCKNENFQCLYITTFSIFPVVTFA